MNNLLYRYGHFFLKVHRTTLRHKTNSIEVLNPCQRSSNDSFHVQHQGKKQHIIGRGSN